MPVIARQARTQNHQVESTFSKASTTALRPYGFQYRMSGFLKCRRRSHLHLRVPFTIKNSQLPLFAIASVLAQRELFSTGHSNGSNRPLPENVTEDQRRTDSGAGMRQAIVEQPSQNIRTYSNQHSPNPLPLPISALHFCPRGSLHAPLTLRRLCFDYCYAAVCSAQKPSAPSSTASCNLDDGRQIYIRYNPVTVRKTTSSPTASLGLLAALP